MKSYLRFGLLMLMLAPSVVGAQPSKQAAFTARAKQFFNLLEARKYTECMSLFDSSLIKVLDADKIKLNWEPIRDAMGKLVKQDGEVFEDKKSYVLVYVNAKYEKESMALKVAFNPEMKIIGFFKNKEMSTNTYTLPSYARPDETIERPITVVTDTFTLHGILTLPKGVAKAPVVVMVQGSGPSDLDESIGQNKPFKDIAYGLARAGIATIRYDKRTFVYGTHSAANPQLATPDDEAVNDALSALKLARTINEIDHDKVYLLGHSLGAMLAPRIAERDKHLAGIIMLAAPARPFQDVILDQMEFLLPQQASKEKAEAALVDIRAMAARVTKHQYSDTTSPTQLFGLDAAYWDYLGHYDQLKTAASLTIPILYLRGGKDYQVTEKDFSMWGKAIGDKQNVEMKIFGNLYHLFMPGKGTYTDYDVAGNVDESVLSTIASWIKRH